MRDAHCHLWSGEIQNLCLWQILYHQIRPQTPGIHLPKETGRHPAQQQHMLLCLQGYGYIIYYHPSKEMALHDMLSCFSPCPGPDIPLDIAMHHAHLSPEQKEASQQAFVSDPDALTDVIITAWPDDIKAVPHPLHPYWQHHETLTVEDGLVLCEEGLVVPPLERERILQQLHQFHQGITKAQLLTCGCIFWPCINKAIEQDVCQCETCTQFQARNAAAPLTPTLTPSCPWQMCAMIFTLEGVNYLIYSDIYSKMILVQHLPSGQSNTIKVISLLKKCSQNMEFQKFFALTVVPNMQVPSLLISAPLGVSPIRPQALTIYN